MIPFRLICQSFSILLFFSISTLALSQSQNSVGQAGNYLIHQCFDKISDVTKALDILWTMVTSAVEEASYGTGNPAYDAFFKNGTEKEVREILINIRDGTAKQTLQSGPNKQSPVFFCAKSLNHLILYGVDIFARCLQGSRPPAMYAEGMNIIFLCPRHWEMPLDPTYVCPTVANNLFQGNPLGLLNSMPMNLLHELVHFYVDSMRAKGAGLEVADWNEIVHKLSAADSAKNAYSYVYYVAATRAQCKAFPDTNDKRLNRDRSGLAATS